MFIGRERESQELEQLYSQKQFQLFILYGRRRVGKTTFLKEFCKEKPSIFYSAEQSNDTLNLQKFSALVFSHYGETELASFPSWDNALLYIHQRQLAAAEPLVLVFDEFPYLASSNPGILSMLQHLIDHTLKEGYLFLILCGSYMRFMEKEVLGAKSPLFGRRTGQLHMRSFDYKTSIQFLSDFSPEEKLLLYGALGGTALYLEQIQSDQSIKENLTRLFLRPTGYLYEEPSLLLRQEVQEPGIYNAIIEAIAQGASRSNEIATKVGEPPSKCLKYIDTLCQLGILYKESPFGEKPGSRKTIYCISDFMFRFWYRYVAGNKTLLETDAQELVWNRRIEPDLSHYMGHVFEIICRDYLLRENSAGRLPLLFTGIGRFWGTDPRSHSQIEIDLVARDGSCYLFGECKWKNTPVGPDILEDLRHKAAIFGKAPSEVFFALFSKSGFTNTLRETAAYDPHVLLFSLEDLL